MNKRTIELFKTVIYANYLKLNNEKKFKKKLNLIYKKTKGRKLTNVGGYQSEDLSIEDFDFLPFTQAITNEANQFLKEYQSSSSLKLSNFWLNVNGFKDYNSLHTHPNSIFSGVYYISVPKNSGQIHFDNGNKFLIDWAWCRLQYNNYDSINSTVYKITPENNLLLIFPSWLPHSVLPNLNKKEKRISISFNFIME
jgi:uncharacterized protein (TIGR02466 family)